MAGNPVLGFLSAQPTEGPRGTVTKNLRLLGILGLAWFVVNAITNLLSATMGTAYLDTGAASINVASAIISIVIGALITAAILFWVTYTINAWTTGQANGATHALVLGILAVVFGGLGVLGAVAGSAILGAAGALYGSGVSVLATVMGVLTLVVSGLELYCGIMVLVNRGKATAGMGTGTTVTN